MNDLDILFILLIVYLWYIFLQLISVGEKKCNISLLEITKFSFLGVVPFNMPSSNV